MSDKHAAPLAPRPGNVFSGVPLDRLALSRKDEPWLAAQLTADSSLFVPYWRDKHLVGGDVDPRAAFLSRDAIDGLLDGNEEIALLGQRVDTADGALPAYFGIDLSHADEAAVLAAAPGAALQDIREIVQIIPTEEASILSYARGLMYWHARHRFCGVCGGATVAEAAGHERKCTAEACGTSHFPRTDAAVIVLVHDGDHCLLGRQSRWPTGMHSTLAGFLEPGESLEETVQREIFEESGVPVVDVRYHSSQPWPLPGSLMVGFMARALSRDLVIDEEELEYAIWMSRDDLLKREESDRFRLPGTFSIARRLIEDWMAGHIPD
ncbi:MAG: NAD(+) diphosphatase [Alphaproteobacteria bacterium]|jgi:NAD+ diphosphatase|nr:NAD(+) diphosphatase [Alphaproteobacteria bacterium]